MRNVTKRDFRIPNESNCSLDDLLAQTDREASSSEIDWGPDVGLERLDYLPELLANVDPDEIGWDWDVNQTE